MQVHLPPELEAFATEMATSEWFNGPDDVVCSALWLLKDQVTLAKIKQDDLRKLISVSIEQLDRGETVSGELVFSRLHEKIRRRNGGEAV